MDSKHHVTINGLIAFIYDITTIPIAWLFAYWLRFNLSDIPPLYYQQALNILPVVIVSQVVFFKLFGLHRGVWRFASVPDLIRILNATIIGICFVSAILFLSKREILFFHKVSVPLAIPLLYGLILISLLSVSRLLIRFVKDYQRLFVNYKKVIIVGAGKAGEGLVRELLRQDNHSYKPIIFVDDDINKLGKEIHGIRVAGTTTKLSQLILKYKIDLVLIAMPSASSNSLCSVVNHCEKAGVTCYTLPSIKAITEGHISINALRNISLEDLLGRYEVNLNWTNLKEGLTGKTIMVTGGGGSIGSEICRQIVTMTNLVRLIIIDHSEFSLYSIEKELRDKYHYNNFIPYLQSITDRVGIRDIINRHRPQVIFHAAAYKHVPILENQIRSALYNNLIGTRILAEEAATHNVDKFILISSDKAVNPSNIMGATKRAAEYFCQSFNKHLSKTRFVTVRFGNVLDSAGSVVPLFRKQIEMGGPVTVTHPEVMRYFMTIPEASQLILQATLLGNGGEIFVLDMGNPIKISYLAEQMIKLSGKSIDKDIKIIYTGLRPGEKLFEECFYSHEELQPTSHSKIMHAKSNSYDFNIICNLCNRIEQACHNNDSNTLLSLLHILVPEYHPNVNYEYVRENEKELA